MDFSITNDNLLKKFELCSTSKIEDSIFMELGNIRDRDEVKIQLFDLYKKASKPDRRIIDVLINLLKKLSNDIIKKHKIEEQELLVNYVDSILNPCYMILVMKSYSSGMKH
ncbi:hypothetical protein BDF20DRAFT_866220 [Mycotypha africana]|uniref:uncharacterized protein n=1 Tax=Mycotypha africana TaxID=64632 RepID=UPI0023009A05|nr:uncharacterized protein BDF20DRAFT_866220 [Mycotypha africana]KAI8982318.1 hypothetical protein BDF20DRAFT_866220 [Mycotypha africana]